MPLLHVQTVANDNLVQSNSRGRGKENSCGTHRNQLAKCARVENHMRGICAVYIKEGSCAKTREV